MLCVNNILCVLCLKDSLIPGTDNSKKVGAAFSNEFLLLNLVSIKSNSLLVVKTDIMYGAFLRSRI